MAAPTWTIGIEEEYQLVDAETRELRPRGGRVLAEARRTLGDEVQPEMMLSQIETASPVCETLADVRAAVFRSRRTLSEAAAKQGCRLAAAGTHPFSDWHDQPVTPKDRYRQLMADFRRLAQEQVIFGCHVHVGIDDREAAVAVMNRARALLTPLLALAANSPFWLGEDTGYVSYRSALWSRWPLSGPPLPFGSHAEYTRVVRSLVATGVIDDPTRIYWDVRLPEKTPTIEFRVTDVCLSADEAVMVAGLTRALARACHQAAARGGPFVPARQEVLRVAHWHASRYGLEGDLIDPADGSRVPASEFVERFLTILREPLDAAGDWNEISWLVRQTLGRGNGAQRQRAAYQRSGRWEDVVDLIVSETAA